MDNKELPKEVQDMVKAQLSDYTPDFYLEDYTKDTIAIFQSHYTPIIEGKDKEVTEQKEMIAKLDNLLSEKESEVKKVMELLKETLTDANMELIITIAKLKGLDINTAIDRFFNTYCKSNSLTDLGGE